MKTKKLLKIVLIIFLLLLVPISYLLFQTYKQGIAKAKDAYIIAKIVDINNIKNSCTTFIFTDINSLNNQCNQKIDLDNNCTYISSVNDKEYISGFKLNYPTKINNEYDYYHFYYSGTDKSFLTDNIKEEIIQELNNRCK